MIYKVLDRNGLQAYVSAPDRYAFAAGTGGTRMPITGFLQTSLYAGTINASYSFSATHHFASPVTVWSTPTLQEVDANSDDAFIDLWISSFVDAAGTHNNTSQPGFQPGIFAEKCRSVTFFMDTQDCVGTAVLTSQFFS